VVRFAALGVLEKGGDGLYRNASNTAPMDATDAQVRQGMLEGSNVNSILEITNLIEISRSYERITRMIEQTTDLSKRAVERLGKV
jgi:flagellar basal-body rod protein FlgF